LEPSGAKQGMVFPGVQKSIELHNFPATWLGAAGSGLFLALLVTFAWRLWLSYRPK
jgi:hypothetical protein